MRIKAAVLVSSAVLLICCAPAMAQGNHSEFFGGATVNYQSTATGQNITDSPTYSAGYLLNYRFHFNDWAAVEVNYAHTRYTQFYSGGTGIINSWTQANAKEASMAFVFQFWSRFNGRLQPFVEGGIGGLSWSPVSDGSVGGPFSQNRPALLYGGGFDWKAFGHFGLRLGYRGLFFTAPDFNVNGQFTNARTQMKEPYAGITYRF
ncbi:MAG TPA: outer membrane beta-barrel protein [Candidatus Acidoferrales bacterium]|nr:outer membrane beta-barrel protein [Candidatus Acidoferrales bacterium]